MRVGMIGISKGGIRELGMLHLVWRTGFDWGAWGSLTGSVLLLLRVRWRDMEG